MTSARYGALTCRVIARRDSTPSIANQASDFFLTMPLFQNADYGRPSTILGIWINMMTVSLVSPLTVSKIGTGVAATATVSHSYLPLHFLCPSGPWDENCFSGA